MLVLPNVWLHQSSSFSSAGFHRRKRRERRIEVGKKHFGLDLSFLRDLLLSQVSDLPSGGRMLAIVEMDMGQSKPQFSRIEGLADAIDAPLDFLKWGHSFRTQQLSHAGLAHGSVLGSVLHIVERNARGRAPGVSQVCGGTLRPTDRCGHEPGQRLLGGVHGNATNVVDDRRRLRQSLLQELGDRER